MGVSVWCGSPAPEISRSGSWPARSCRSEAWPAREHSDPRCRPRRRAGKTSLKQSGSDGFVRSQFGHDRLGDDHGVIRRAHCHRQTAERQGGTSPAGVMLRLKCGQRCHFRPFHRSLRALQRVIETLHRRTPQFVERKRSGSPARQDRRAGQRAGSPNIAGNLHCLRPVEQGIVPLNLPDQRSAHQLRRGGAKVLLKCPPVQLFTQPFRSRHRSAISLTFGLGPTRAHGCQSHAFNRITMRTCVLPRHYLDSSHTAPLNSAFRRVSTI